MIVAGFTFIRNAIKYDYPIVEAIKSILPLCDYVVVAIGDSDDRTEELITGLNEKKIRIIHTVWDESVPNGGVLAVETNKAFDAIGNDADWCFYIQGDEVFNSEQTNIVRASMLKYKDNAQTQGLLFHYRHFYGSYDYIGTARGWYRHEIRIIKNDKKIRSYRDAQGFRIEGKKLRVRLIDAYIHHYGWVRNPEAQQRKQLNFNKYWRTDEWISENVPDVESFDYSQVDGLSLYIGNHPEVIQPRIQKLNWKFTFDPTRQSPFLRKRILMWIEQKTGWRIGEYRNFKKI